MNLPSSGESYGFGFDRSHFRSSPSCYQSSVEAGHRCSTYTYALGKLDAQECTAIISAALTRLDASRRCGSAPSRLLSQPRALESGHVAFDGKALRGTHGHEAAHQPPVHLCAFYEVATGNVLAQ